MPNIQTLSQKKFFYGWYIVALGIFGTLMSIPGQTMGVSVFTDHLIEALNISRNQLSLSYMMGTIGSALILSFSGKVLDKIGSRKFGVTISILFGLSLMGLSRVDLASRLLGESSLITPVLSSILLITLGFFLIRFLGQGSLTLVSRTLPMRWFEKRRGLVNAITGTFVSFGFSSSPRLLSFLIDTFGWRGTWLLAGFVMIGITAPLFLIIARDSPEAFGLKKDGMIVDDTEDRAKNENNKTNHDKFKKQYTLKEARKTLTFWVYTASLSMFSLFITGFTFHVVSIFKEAGMDATTAVKIFIPGSVISVFINLGLSSISDYIKLKYILFVEIIALTAVMLSIAFLTPGMGMLFLIIANGITGGVFTVLVSLSWPRFFGTEHLGAISGFSMTFLVAGSAIGPILLSLSLSLTGSYAASSLICAVMMGIVFVAALFLREPTVTRS